MNELLVTIGKFQIWLCPNSSIVTIKNTETQFCSYLKLDELEEEMRTVKSKSIGKVEKIIRGTQANQFIVDDCAEV